MVLEGREIPLFKNLFINGHEVLTQEHASVDITATGDGLTIATASMIAGRLEVITESEMEARLTEE